MDKDSVLSLDNGMYKIWFARNYRSMDSYSVLLDNALATMGAGLPVAIAAKMIFPEKKAVALTRLNPPLPIECFLVEGKTVSDTAIAGRITHLAENSAEVFLDKKQSAYTNLRVVLASPETRGLSELYAKVLPHDKSDGSATDHRARLQFTSMPQDTKDFLDKRQSDG